MKGQLRLAAVSVLPADLCPRSQRAKLIAATATKIDALIMEAEALLMIVATTVVPCDLSKVKT